jgi:hypothetical protein
VQRPEPAQHRVLAAVEERRGAARERAQLLGVLQPPRLLVEPLVLARRQPRVLDLLDDVAQVVGAALGLGAAGGQGAHLLAHRGQLAGGVAHPVGLRVRAAERVEDPALRVGVEQRLRLVLAVQVDEQAPDLGEHARGHRRAVRPRPRAPPGGDLALEHHRVLVDLQPALVEQAREVVPAGDVEHALDAGAVGAGADELRARALAQQQSERADDDRLARAGLAREHVEPAGEREGQRLDDREVLDPEFGQHARAATPPAGARRRARRPRGGRGGAGAPRGVRRGR